MSVNMTAGVMAATETYSTYNTAKSSREEAKTQAYDTGVVYEKSEETSSKATYSINKMSESDRAALVSQLKADQQSRQEQLVNIVKQMMTKQASSYGIATGDDSIWKFLASGNFTVDEATRAQAQADIAEDGYYGVKQTSQRLFDFASALAGDDVDKMREMQAAMEKGFRQATGAWGKSLPQICSDTIDAANKMFEDYYASKQ